MAIRNNGSVVKRLRHRPFTAVTRVRFPSESFGVPIWLNWQSADCHQQVSGLSPFIGFAVSAMTRKGLRTFSSVG